MQLPDYVKKIISALESAGFEAYCVGGCVRDSLLSLPCSDYDVTTSALPSETKAALAVFPIFETGIKHGTVTAVIEGHPIEITTFRSEKGYSDHRHPDTVYFSKALSEDLSRRDFTVNAMAYNDKSGIIDLFGGKKDLENRLIRCVGNPQERFTEDALRPLRALRFAACLSFSIEEKTSAAIKEKLELLSFVSKERIYSELCRLVCGDNAAEILMDFPEVFNFLFSVSTQDKTLRKIAANSLSCLPKEVALRLAALFRFLKDTPKESAKVADKILSSLKSDRATRSAVASLLTALPLPLAEDLCAVKQLLRQYGASRLLNLISLERSVPLIMRHQTDKQLLTLQKQIEKIEKSGECYRLCDLSISGSDLITLGFSGTAIGSTLDFLLTRVIKNEIPNEHTALVAAAKDLL